MEKPDVSSLLSGLEPTTEYAEFLKLWPAICEARERKVTIKAIYQALVNQKMLTISYVTFTRFVNKKKAESGTTSDMPKISSQRDKVASAATNKPGESQIAEKQVVHQESDTSDKSEQIATDAANALKEARQVSSSKNYAKNIRNR